MPGRHLAPRRAVALPALLPVLALVACGGGGGGGGTTTPVVPTTPSSLTLTLPRHALEAAQLAVIVAEGDALSEAVASHYQAERGIPAANIIRVRLPGSGDTITAADFTTLKADIDARLPAGVQATLLTWIAPTRVVGACAMGITSAMAFGYDTRYCGAACSTTASSPYYDSESNQPWADHRMRPSMLLGARTLDAARTLIARGRAADASQPAGDGYLVRTSDALRSVRWDDFVALPAAWAGRLQLNYIDNSAGTGSDTISGRSHVLFYFTGLSRVAELTSNSFHPGAAADSLTSSGGVLPGGNGQMPITEWLEAGATASYGTVEEPCNRTAKFPKASVLIDQYWRGASLIEAYWRSVQAPGQGLFVGEPLARPWPDLPSLKIEGGQYVIATRALRANARYALEYRSTAGGAWTTLAAFTPTRAGPQVLNAPLAPSSAVELRWAGPCPGDPGNTGLQCTLASSASN